MRYTVSKNKVWISWGRLQKLTFGFTCTYTYNCACTEHRHRHVYICTHTKEDSKSKKGRKSSNPARLPYQKKKKLLLFSPNRTQWELREGRSLATVVPCSWIVRLNMVLLLHLVSKFKRKNSNQTKANQNTSKTNNTNTSKALFTVIRIWSSSLAWIV